MNRAWWGIAVLAASWLVGRDYFAPANWAAWVVAIGAGAVLLRGLRWRWDDGPGKAFSVAECHGADSISRLALPNRHGQDRASDGRGVKIGSAILAVPAVVLMPLPCQAIPGLLAAGSLLHALPLSRRWLRSVGVGAMTASLVLLVQALALWLYAVATARQHALCGPLVHLVGWCLRLGGLDVAITGSSLVTCSGGEVYRIVATWELLVDPASLSFLAGGCLLLACQGHKAWGSRWADFVRLFSVAAAWLPVRAVILIALVLHRALRSDPITAPNVADVLVNSWFHVVLLSGLAGLVTRAVRWGHADVGDGASMAEHLSSRGCSSEDAVAPAAGPPRSSDTWRPGGRAVAAAVCAAAGVALVVSCLHWVPVGTRKGGRVLVVEKHSAWEPTTEPYGTQVYGERGSYNYAAAYYYCGQYFEMSRLLETEALDDTALSRCDVLVIKTPTVRYAPQEIDAIERFVAQGGAVLLVGDHTNVFRMCTCLNDIARRFGFSFRNDLLFRVGTPYQQRYVRPVAAHPAVQHVPRMDFAVSCSIDPGDSPGRMVIRSTGLWSLPPAYQEINYHPQAEYRPHMEYGAWCQMWSTTYGRGRVLAFADSTLFSNFCIFQPGKAELLRGMLHWLNHTSRLDQRGLWSLVAIPWVLAGLTCVGAGWWWSRRTRAAGTVLVAAGLAGWAVAVGAVSAAHSRALPEPPCLRPLQHVVIDRALSEVPLFTGAFTDGEEGVGYGMLEQWIPRLGNVLSRRTGPEVFCGDALVVICPTRSVPAWYRERLVPFVEAGGRLVVFDSGDVAGSTANSLLGLFGLSSNHNRTPSSETPLKLVSGATEVTVEAPCEIAGGEPLAWLGEMPVAARSRYGRGAVTAIGCGALFNDANMGVHWLPEPSSEVRRRYEVLYTLLREALASPARSPNPGPGREG